MDKKFLISIFIVVIIIIVIAFILFYFHFSSIESSLVNNMDDFIYFSNFFLSQNEINNISINTRNDYECKVINQWGICPREETKWGRLTGEVINGEYQEEYSDTFEEVLNKENINRDAYNRIIEFMYKYKIRGIGKDTENNYLEFEKDLDGLRYYIDSNSVFLEDSEYLEVKRINNNWYLFFRDWN